MEGDKKDLVIALKVFRKCSIMNLVLPVNEKVQQPGRAYKK